MIRSVVREFKWPPEVINNLYVDDSDFEGLEFWYTDVKEMSEELKKKK